MKNEEKLQTVIRFMNWIENDPKHNDITDWAKESRRLIQEFMVDNMAKSKTTFNLTDYTAKNDDLQPVMNGVCYDPATKSAIATDAHIMVVDRAAYDQSIVNKFADKADKNGRITIDKYGNVIEYAYPNYLRAFPKYEHATDYTIDMDDLQDYIKRCRAYCKTHQLGTKNIFEYRVGDPETPAYFDAKLLLSFAIATDGHISIDDRTRAAVWYGDVRDALIMPMYPPTDEDIAKMEGYEEGLIIKS